MTRTLTSFILEFM